MPKDSNTKLADSVMTAVGKLSPHTPSADAIRRLNELLYKSEFNSVFPIEPRDVDQDGELKCLFKGLLKMCHSKERLTKLEIMAIWTAILGPAKEKSKGKKAEAKAPDESSSDESSDESEGEGEGSESDSDSDSDSGDKPSMMYKCHNCPGNCKSHRTKECPYRKKGSTRGKKKVGN
tara:strand:- start:282 stop:812 length:531 start_codon:yes stop_codon:yes gene_type:complete